MKDARGADRKLALGDDAELAQAEDWQAKH